MSALSDRAQDAEWIRRDARRYRQLIAQGRHTPWECEGFAAIADRLERIASTLERPCREYPGATHYPECWRDPGHHNCAIAEIESLRGASA